MTTYLLYGHDTLVTIRFQLATWGWCGVHVEIMTGKKKSFSLNEKHRLLDIYDKLPKMSQWDAAMKPGVPQATLCSVLKQQETVMAASDGDRKRMRAGKAPVIKAALIKWIDNVQSHNAP